MQGWPIATAGLRVRGGEVRLRAVRRRDARRWSELRLADRAQLERWEPTQDGTFRELNSAMMWPAIAARQRKLARRGAVIPAAIELDGELCGQLTIGSIQWGAVSSAWIGYWVSSRYTGRGVATAALALGTDHALGAAGLHRLEATVQPENAASVRVLERCGYRREGFLLRYLHVNGAWRDHLLVARTVEEHGRGAAELLVQAGLAELA